MQIDKALAAAGGGQLLACSCRQCRKSSYNSYEFQVRESDFQRLSDARPFGLSGHLRVKNEEASLRACVESIIDNLDELIITYQESSDKTQQIVQQLAQEYPDKIKIYFYAPYVIPHTYAQRHEAFSDEYPLPESIHHPANYYNYGFVKISYQYYMKVDADQIYFAPKMAFLRALLKQFEPRGSSLCSMSFVARAQRRLICWLVELMPCLSLKLNLCQCFELPVAFVLGGINISRHQGRLGMGIRKGSCSPFNGLVGDTIVFSPGENERYIQHPYLYCEAMKYKACYIPIGFFWLHLGPLKDGEKFYNYQKNEYILLGDLSKISKTMLIRKYKILRVLSKASRKIFKKFWQNDRLCILQPNIDLCEKSAQFFPH